MRLILVAMEGGVSRNPNPKQNLSQVPKRQPKTNQSGKISQILMSLIALKEAQSMSMGVTKGYSTPIEWESWFQQLL
jgi:hypothetical protein